MSLANKTRHEAPFILSKGAPPPDRARLQVNFLHYFHKVLSSSLSRLSLLQEGVRNFISLKEFLEVARPSLKMLQGSQEAHLEGLTTCGDMKGKVTRGELFKWNLALKVIKDARLPLTGRALR